MNGILTELNKISLEEYFKSKVVCPFKEAAGFIPNMDIDNPNDNSKVQKIRLDCETNENIH